MSVLLTDEEIEKVKEGVNNPPTVNGILVLHIYDEQRAIAKAQLKKAVEDIEKHSAVEQLPLRDGRVSIRTIPEDYWQALLKEME